MQIEGDYTRDGAVCVRDAFTRAEIELARDAIEANLAAPSPLAIIADDARGRFVEDFCNWQRIPQIERFIRDTRAAELAHQLIGGSTVRLYHDHLLVKERGAQHPTPWHQDLPYYNVDGTRNVSMWIPVDPVPREATLRLLAGSHRGPWFMPRTFITGQAKWFPEGSLAELPEIADDDPRILAWELEPGDAVCFHMLTLHAAGSASGAHRRRVLSLRFLGDDMVHAPRGWRTSPPFDGLVDELPAGAPLDHPLFPLLRG